MTAPPGCITKFYWHIHDDVLLEPATEPIENRIAYIKSSKPAREIEPRLRLLKPVQGILPTEVLEAWEGCNKAREVCWKVWEAYWKAREVYQEALVTHKTEIEALHAKECPSCPWNGETIFP